MPRRHHAPRLSTTHGPAQGSTAYAFLSRCISCVGSVPNEPKSPLLASRIESPRLRLSSSLMRLRAFAATRRRFGLVKRWAKVNSKYRPNPAPSVACRAFAIEQQFEPTHSRLKSGVMRPN